jgi:hypothetical protein
VAVVAFSITKSVPFRDSVQEFSNVYHYKTTDRINATEGANRIAELVAFEKSIHGATVSFKRGRAWNAGGTNQENDMVHQEALSGNGTNAAGSTQDPERAFLFMWPAGLDSRGKPVFLRKWYHLQANIGTASLTTSIVTQASGFTQAQRDNAAAIINACRLIGSGLYQLCAESGRDSQGAARMHKYFEHHQLGDQWRSQ